MILISKSIKIFSLAVTPSCVTFYDSCTKVAGMQVIKNFNFDWIDDFPRNLRGCYTSDYSLILTGGNIWFFEPIAALYIVN